MNEEPLPGDAPKDHVYEDDGPSDRPAFERHVKSGSTWLRLFFMLVVAILWSVSRFVTAAVIVIQFFWVLFTGETNAGLLRFGAQLARYSYQLISYLTFNTEARPFPFDLDWPAPEPLEPSPDA
jgi:Domain of unknown function (DUF4389)